MPVRQFIGVQTGFDDITLVVVKQKTFFHLLWWDVILNQAILRWFRFPPQPRWQRIAFVYRILAIETGGLLVKLGQFLSLRVDLLPAEVTRDYHTKWNMKYDKTEK
jgi:predicted unusual protein kinase regulating ubiquinone biosynthesis (AarF/ABC1/UbiB family)